METRTYKAFISYSHQDEVWAKWLHKALESYKLPKHLRDKTHAGRLAPVFRDRDDLPSAANLTEKVQGALRDSESLVVICSPASASSRWVNEEIRLFRFLGRENQIHCIIVDGDPQATTLEETCFPPALLEGGVGESHEPLAADARKWADGKSLAKLKLISGILGIRLDDLRQREQKRKRKLQALYAVVALVAIALVSMTVVSRIEEKARREQAEILVTQFVEISSDLDSVVDLETLRTMSVRLQGYLNTIKPKDLTPESNKQVALVLRQLGGVSKAQGRLDEAMEAYTRSKTILSQLAAEFPENLDFLYELGNAEFYVAGVHLENLEYDLAEKASLNYKDVADRLLAADSLNPAWMMEVSYAHTNLAALKERSSEANADEALKHLNLAVELSEQAMGLEPDNNQYISQFVRVLSWFADAQMQICDIEGALSSRSRNVLLARDLALAAPANNELRKEQAYSLSGLADIQRQAGQIGPAAQSLKEASVILDNLVLLDPSNIKYQWEALRLTAFIADLDSDTGDLEDALDQMQSIYSNLQAVLLNTPKENVRRRQQIAQYFLNFAAAAMRAGDVQKASDLLDEALTSLDTALRENANDRSSRDRISLAAFQWWQIHGDASNPVISKYAIEFPRKIDKKLGCNEANLAARQAILNDDQQLAAEFTSYLSGKGYFDPDFRRFCKEYSLCDK